MVDVAMLIATYNNFYEKEAKCEKRNVSGQSPANSMHRIIVSNKKAGHSDAKLL